MNRKEILKEAGTLISGQRAKDYGDAHMNMVRIGRMWGAILDLPDLEPEIVTAMLVSLKVARLANTPTHEDSWVDIAGYGALGGEIACDSLE